MEVIAQQIADMALRANRWLNFSLACAWAAFIISVIAFAYLMLSQYAISHKPKHGKEKK